MNVKHSKVSNRWGTPANYVALARAALGGHIELDPMSEPLFNAIVGADRIFTEQDDCFKHEWRCETMLLNPPGGLVVLSWQKLIQEYQAGRTKRCIWIGFSVEQLNLLANELLHPLSFSTLLTRKRISFIRHDGFTGAPGHANYVTGLGIDKQRFDQVFRAHGQVTHGVLSS